MKRGVVLTKGGNICALGLSLAAILGTAAIASANSFYANTDQLAYDGTGTVQNVTAGTAPVTTTSPRDAELYELNNIPSLGGNANTAGSNWYENATSNTNDSFFQLYDDGESVTSATGTWNAAGTTFTMTVTGANAPYNYSPPYDTPGDDSASRLWRPDVGDAPGGTFISYTLTLTATFDTPAALQGGILTSQGNLLSMSSEFKGTFQPTLGSGNTPIINGDIYAFDFNMDYATFLTNTATDPLADSGYGVQNASQFGQVVPLPASAWSGLALLGGIAAFGAAKRFRRQLV